MSPSPSCLPCADPLNATTRSYQVRLSTLLVLHADSTYPVRSLLEHARNDVQVLVCALSVLSGANTYCFCNLRANGDYGTPKQRSLEHFSDTWLPSTRRGCTSSRYDLECTHRPPPFAEAPGTSLHLCIPGRATCASWNVSQHALLLRLAPRTFGDVSAARFDSLAHRPCPMKATARSRHETTLNTVSQPGQRRITPSVPAPGYIQCPFALATVFGNLTGAPCGMPGRLLRAACVARHIRFASNPSERPLARPASPSHPCRPRTPARALSTTEFCLKRTHKHLLVRLSTQLLLHANPTYFWSGFPSNTPRVVKRLTRQPVLQLLIHSTSCEITATTACRHVRRALLGHAASKYPPLLHLVSLQRRVHGDGPDGRLHRRLSPAVTSAAQPAFLSVHQSLCCLRQEARRLLDRPCDGCSRRS